MAKQPEYKLTPKQEAFAVEFVINGGNATAAYKKTYEVTEHTKESTIYTDAYKVAHRPQVALKIHQLRMMQSSPLVLSVEERKIILSEAARDGDHKAMDMLNRMDGAYEKDNEQKKPEAILNITRNIVKSK